MTTPVTPVTPLTPVTLVTHVTMVALVTPVRVAFVICKCLPGQFSTRTANFGFQRPSSDMRSVRQFWTPVLEGWMLGS